MIVADTSLISYLVIEGTHTPLAERVLQRDSEWRSPLLWRSEFRNILVLYMRQGMLSFDQSVRRMQRAESLMRESEHGVFSTQVLNLAASSRCPAYDCEFVALAQELDVSLVTADSRILSNFPSVAVSIEEFASS